MREQVRYPAYRRISQSFRGGARACGSAAAALHLHRLHRDRPNRPAIGKRGLLPQSDARSPVGAGSLQGLARMDGP